ncbi:ArgS-related anticodon-binding protein NrtL [Streptomyces sp. NPDC005263]|uniref:ArgS-related anticodon-binding protein NrtL n=1 Tax=Streptomyces sp. NPDC005263 TaxID=3364711 RepID=UPI0036CDE8D6
MIPVELSRTVLRAVRRAVDRGELTVTVPERAVVTVPGPGGCGDYATNIALQLARPAERTPRYVAEVLRHHLLSDDIGTDARDARDATDTMGARDDIGTDTIDAADTSRIADVVITGPGFLNFRLRGTASAGLVGEILRRGQAYGYSDALTGQLRRLHAAHEVRALVVADAGARLLRAQGARVRVTCEARPEPEWVGGLGVHVDAYGTPESSAETTRLTPVPTPADPTPLGPDAARWALLHPAAHDRPRIGDEHLVQRESNPLFRVRYAHARTRAVSRNAADLGFHAEPGDVPEEEYLTGVLADHPRILAAAAAHCAPDRLARHLVTVADAVLPFLPTVLPRGGEKPSAAHRARLALAEAAGTVLAGGLTLLGIDAPDHL